MAMHRFALCVSLLGLTALITAAGEDAVVKAQPLRLELDLVDGSHISGTTGIETVPVETAYAKMNVPLKQIRSLQIDKDHETVTLCLQNGDKLKGVVTLTPIKLTTVFGQISVGVEHIKQLDVVPTGGALPESLRKGLVLYYSFDRDEGGKVTDASGKGHGGQVDGATWTPQGKVGGACSFDGANDSITVPGYKGILGNDPWTVSIWFKRGNASAAQQEFVGWGGWGSGVRGDIVEILLSGGELYEHYGALDYHTGVFVNDTEWHHYVVVKGADTQQRYLDGASLNKATSFTLAVGSSSDVTIGKRQVMNELYFVGLLDEACLYDRALSENEVKGLYEARK